MSLHITFKIRAVLVVFVLTALLVLLRHYVIGAGVLVLDLALLAVVPSRKLPAHRVRHMRLRLRLRLHPGRGHASLVELWLRWGRHASYRRSRSLHRSRNPWTHSVRLGWAHFRHGLRVPLEEHVLLMAPPRTHKTALLADMILRYPGAIVSTTTKHDVFELTSGIRAALTGGPIEVFNPQGIGRVPSTFHINLVHGCNDPATAIRRADALARAVSTGGTEDGSFWQARAAACLRALMYAAAIVNGDMRVVTHWALDMGAVEEAEEILVQAGAGMWAKELKQLRGEAQKTAETIRMTIAQALSFMVDPKLAQSVITHDDDLGLDIRQFIRDRGTLYMIASSQGEDSPLAPLFACLATEIHYTASLMGSQQKGGRLDPPMGMFLDEIVQVCPIPLPSMLADSGGKGVQLISVAHGEAQLRTRWGSDGAQAIMDTSGVKLYLPGITDTATLAGAAALCGDVAYHERGQHGSSSRHAVMDAAMIRGLPLGWGLVLRSGLSPVVVRLAVCWQDRLYKRAKRAGTAIARVTAARSITADLMVTPVSVADEAAAVLADGADALEVARRAAMVPTERVPVPDDTPWS